MKTLIGKMTENKRRRKKAGTGICGIMEKTLISLFIVVFVSFITVQAVLTNAGMRSLLVREPLEGEPLGDEVFLFETCRMELKLVGMKECPDLKVLVNGTEAEDFRNGSVLLELRDGDAVELDASRLLVYTEVQVSAASRNLAHLLGKTVPVTGGIAQVTVADTGR